MTSARAVPVTLAEIARIAGVGRAAVSNWRRRYDSFPARIGGTDVSPRFSLAEVEEWLRGNNKIKEVGGREWLWPQFEALRSRDETGLAIAAAGQRLKDPEAGPVSLAGAEPPDEIWPLVDRAVELGLKQGAAETFEFLLRRWLDANVRQITTTPEPLAAVMAELATRVRSPRMGDPLVVLDPACGTGRLLAAAVVAGHGRVTLVGCDKNPTLAALTAARLSFVADTPAAMADIRYGDSLRADPHAGTRADVVLCNPPFNERDWGYEELATDARWTHGMPPRTEPELAWVQHALARLLPGGAAVLLLPPAVASRRAGRRIRGALLRTGALRAVVALPPGSAPPHSVSLHLWVLRAPAEDDPAGGSGRILLADAARYGPTACRETGPDWEALGAFVRAAIDAADSPEDDQAGLRDGITRVPVIDLLDDEVDLTPGRYIADVPPGGGPQLAELWGEFAGLLTGLGDSGALLAKLDLSGSGPGAHPTTTVGELVRAGAVTLRGGRQPANGTVFVGTPTDDGVPLLTVPDLLLGGEPRGWLSLADAEAEGTVVAEPGDVVVAGVARAFSAWVHDGPPTVLGPQLYALRVNPEKLDAGFLAGCLRAPSNGRQAGTHASSSSRVDVRRLQVRQLSLEEQHCYSVAFRQVAAFEKLLTRVGDFGSTLVRDLSDALVAGQLASE